MKSVCQTFSIFYEHYILNSYIKKHILNRGVLLTGNLVYIEGRQVYKSLTVQ